MRHASESSRRDGASERHASAPGTTSVGEQTCTFLRRLHPRATAENVAADLKAWRIKSTTVAKMLERQSAPGTHLMVALICVYGPEFLSAALPTSLGWLDAAARAQRKATLEASMDALRQEMERL